MYIEPNTDIRILKGVPLDKTYEHTIRFTSESAQYNYFHSKEKYSLSNYTYQRVNRGVARVGIRAEHLYDCNYMMFRNEAFTSKWFYAFIDSVEYVNNATAEIRFTIDVVQSWLFNFTLENSWVEREHTATDAIGEHLIEENLDTGDFAYKHIDAVNYTPANCAIIVASSVRVSGGVIQDDNPTEGAIYGGIYSGIKFLAFHEGNYSDTVQAVDDYLSLITKANKAESVVSIFMFPTALLDFDSNGDIAESVTAKTVTHSFPKQELTLDGYTPHNNKMFCYPYNRLYLFTGDGTSAEYRFEKFSGRGCNFKVSTAINCAPEIIAVPQDYNGVGTNYNERLTVSNLPQCAYTIDAFRAWVASRGGDTLSYFSEFSGLLGQTASALGSTFSAVEGFADPGVKASGFLHRTGSMLNSVGNVASTLGAMRARRTQPPQVHGSSSAGAMFSLGKMGFNAYQCCCMYDYAKAIDSFFDKFGYKVNVLKVPSIYNRKHFTYVKTMGCNMRGNMPQDDIEAICSLFDRGITFWNGGDHVGEYAWAIADGNDPIGA